MTKVEVQLNQELSDIHFMLQVLLTGCYANDRCPEAYNTYWGLLITLSLQSGINGKFPSSLLISLNHRW
jgi:hypothetical protein